MVPLLEIPMAEEHLIGITRLLFNDDNRVTRGVGMFTVADGSKRGTSSGGEATDGTVSYMES